MDKIEKAKAERILRSLELWPSTIIGAEEGFAVALYENGNLLIGQMDDGEHTQHGVFEALIVFDSSNLRDFIEFLESCESKLGEYEAIGTE